MNIAEMKLLDDVQAENKARGEILNAITKNIGEGNCWMEAADMDWHRRLRDFATDSDNHQITRNEWKTFHDTGKITLFLSGTFATAYFDDAAELWNQADDEHPMFHVMIESDPPHRTCIHLIHLVNWIVLLSSRCYPVQIVDMEFVGE